MDAEHLTSLLRSLTVVPSSPAAAAAAVSGVLLDGDLTPSALANIMLRFFNPAALGRTSRQARLAVERAANTPRFYERLVRRCFPRLTRLPLDMIVYRAQSPDFQAGGIYVHLLEDERDNAAWRLFYLRVLEFLVNLRVDAYDLGDMADVLLVGEAPVSSLRLDDECPVLVEIRNAVAEQRPVACSDALGAQWECELGPTFVSRVPNAVHRIHVASRVDGRDVRFAGIFVQNPTRPSVGSTIREEGYVNRLPADSVALRPQASITVGNLDFGAAPDSFDLRSHYQLVIQQPRGVDLSQPVGYLLGVKVEVRYSCDVVIRPSVAMTDAFVAVRFRSPSDLYVRPTRPYLLESAVSPVRPAPAI